LAFNLGRKIFELAVVRLRLLVLTAGAMTRKSLTRRGGRGGGRRGDIAEGLEDVKGTELEGGMVELGSIEACEKVGAGFLSGPVPGEPVLLEQPILEAALSPLAEVARLELFAIIAKALNDVGIGDTIEHPVIDLVADVFGQAGDFAVAAIGEGSGGLGRRRFICAGVRVIGARGESRGTCRLGCGRRHVGLIFGEVHTRKKITRI